MSTKAPITLKKAVTELLASGNFGSRSTLILDDKDVRLLLRAAIEQEESISAFSRRHGLELSQLNKMLNGRRPVSRVVVKALGLRKVYVAEWPLAASPPWSIEEQAACFIVHDHDGQPLAYVYFPTTGGELLSDGLSVLIGTFAPLIHRGVG
jgi:hypothetical protein